MVGAREHLSDLHGGKAWKVPHKINIVLYSSIRALRHSCIMWSCGTRDKGQGLAKLFVSCPGAVAVPTLPTSWATDLPDSGVDPGAIADWMEAWPLGGEAWLSQRF